MRAKQKNRSNVLVLAVIGLAVLAWIFIRDPSGGSRTEVDGDVADTESTPEEDVAPPIAVALPRPAPDSSAQLADPSSPPKVGNIVPQGNASPSQGRRPLPPGAVPYRLEDNLMISYGDIVLGLPQASDAPRTGFAEMPSFRTWPSGTIPFLITPLVNQDRIRRVLAYFNENTPVRFIPFAGQKDALIFEPAAEHCRSYLGRVGGHQPIFLSSGCTEPEIAHEIMHALGFIHEQSRPDRDRFIKIHWDRIEPDKADQFDFVPAELATTTEGRPFDFQSVMIYEPTSFARTPGEIVIESRTGTPIEPVRTGLSREDLERIELLYR